MLMCGRCFATYHLGMILTIILVEPIENRTRLLGVPDLHANHYTVGIGRIGSQVRFPKGLPENG